MKPHKATLFCALSLILIGLLGAYSAYSDNGSIPPTPFIPVAIGVILLLLLPGIKKENKVVAHIAVALVLLILFALAMPLKAAIARAETMSIMRVAFMMLACVIAMIAFVQSFIAARKARESQG